MWLPEHSLHWCKLLGLCADTELVLRNQVSKSVRELVSMLQASENQVILALIAQWRYVSARREWLQVRSSPQFQVCLEISIGKRSSTWASSKKGKKPSNARHYKKYTEIHECRSMRYIKAISDHCEKLNLVTNMNRVVWLIDGGIIDVSDTNFPRPSKFEWWVDYLLWPRNKWSKYS